MSALTDAILEAGPHAVARVIADDPAWQVFNLMWNTPEEIAPACDRMGWQTLDELLDWVHEVNAAVRNQLAFVDLVDPIIPFTLDGMPTVTMQTIHQAIVDQAVLRDDAIVEQSDVNYRLATKKQWEQLAALCPIRRRAWVAETGDCDDYVRAFMGWLASHGLGNLAQAFCGLTMYDLFGGMSGGHAVVLVMDDTHKLWFLDPQPGRLYEVTNPRLGGFIFAKSVKIARAFF